MAVVPDQNVLTHLRACQSGTRRLPRVNVVIGGVLVLTLLATIPDNRRLSDALQVVLPLAALACAAAQGEAPTLLGRYAVLEIGIKTPELAFGDHPIHQQPDGSGRSFLSGNTAAATFGAVHLLHHCGKLHPATKGLVLMGAAFTGGSGIEAFRLTVWQTIAGALWGWACALLPSTIFAWLRRKIWRRA